VRVGTRAGSISIYCAREALADSGVGFEALPKDRVGMYIGITEHGNVETENEIHEVSKYGFDTVVLVAPPQPAHGRQQPRRRGDALLGIPGPGLLPRRRLRGGQPRPDPRHADAAAGHRRPRARRRRVGIDPHVRHLRELQARRVRSRRHEDASKASRPFDRDRNGIVVSEGGCLYTLERLDDALARGAKIYAEVRGYFVNSTPATSCCRARRARPSLHPRRARARAPGPRRHRHRQHARHQHTSRATRSSARRSARVSAARPKRASTTPRATSATRWAPPGALELAGNLPSFDDGLVHPTINVDNLDPQCALPGLVLNEPRKVAKVDTILNNSFGMLGINSTLIVKRFVP
jgi:3-oxoacyl-[acyl-carrier-protein] synthase II